MNLPPPPSATYRLQFHAGFTFEDARRLVPYLHDLGISHMYASPYLRARSGSMHGYDVADPSSLNPELGIPGRLRTPAGRPATARHGPAGRRGAQSHGHRRPRQLPLAGRARERAGVDLRALLRHQLASDPGPATGSAQAGRAHPRRPVRQGARERRAVRVVHAARGSTSPTTTDAFRSRPTRYPVVLESALAGMEEELGHRHEQVQELASILTAIRHLPPRRMLDATAMEERNREKEIVKRRISTLHEVSDAVSGVRSKAELAAINGRAGQASTLRPARCAAGRAVVSAGLLARRGRRDQLPALLRHHGTGGGAHGGPDGLRRHAPAADAADRRRQDPGAAHRPSGRSARPRRVFSPSAGSLAWKQLGETLRTPATRSTSSLKRSSRPAKRCARTGPSAAPPATTSSTTSTASSSPATTSSSSAPSTSASCARAPAASATWPTRPRRWSC